MLYSGMGGWGGWKPVPAIGDRSQYCLFIQYIWLQINHTDLSSNPYSNQCIGSIGVCYRRLAAWPRQGRKEKNMFRWYVWLVYGVPAFVVLLLKLGDAGRVSGIPLGTVALFGMVAAVIWVLAARGPDREFKGE